MYTCNNCGQRIAYYTPQAPEEVLGSIFQDGTFLRLTSIDLRNPDREVAHSWYCSVYCARDDIEIRISTSEEQRLRESEANQLSFSFKSAA